MKLTVYKHAQKGELGVTYAPLKNIIGESGETKAFNVANFGYNLDNPLSIECQPSYDGSVNLIINDDTNPPRIINSRFSKLEDNKYEIVSRNQKQQTNLYSEKHVDEQTRLFRNIVSFPKIHLNNVYEFGQLKGGNYTFYIKFSDDDNNLTDIVAESSQVSVFHGTHYNIASISGTLLDETTNKAISLKIENVDQSFSKIHVFYTREYSDLNGYRLLEVKRIVEPYDITSSMKTITVTGFEETVGIDVSELNIKYNIVDSVKTQAQVQNILFFGNIGDSKINHSKLQQISYGIKVSLKQDRAGVGYVTEDYKPFDDPSRTEYYNPKNIYYKLGYWPEEMYRLGVVYIMEDDSLTPVFNLLGQSWLDETQNFINNSDAYLSDIDSLLLENNAILNHETLENTYGVFVNPKLNVFDSKNIKPLYYEIDVTGVKNILSEYNIKGLFFVRQKRLPITMFQGLSLGIDSEANTPLIYDENKQAYIAESFLSDDYKLVDDFEKHVRVVDADKVNYSALLALDPIVNTFVQTQMDGSDFVLDTYSVGQGFLSNNRRVVVNQNFDKFSNNTTSKLTYIPANTAYRYINDCGYSTKAGMAEDVKVLRWLSEQPDDYYVLGEGEGEASDKTKYNLIQPNLIRGEFCPYVGANSYLVPNSLYNVKQKGYDARYLSDYLMMRGEDNSSFFAISDRFSLQEIDKIDVYRGDCFTNTVTIRLNRNFIDPNLPITEDIVDPNTWLDNYLTYNAIGKYDKDGAKEKINSTYLDGRKGDAFEYGTFFDKINRADTNTVPLGMWITFKCLSSYNLGLRSINSQNTEEMSIMGNPRSFYPLYSISTKTPHKIEESFLLNDGYSASVGRKNNFAVENVPYINTHFDNRVMFSRINPNDTFENSYRIFQGLSYQDIDRQYGAIVKLLPWETNLFCVFEHGAAILPINEKALIQTQTDQSVHMYGAGVLQEQVSLVSPDFGSIWQESIVRTPLGIYGVDTYAKKIWRFTNQNGMETISDMKVQRFLNDFINLQESDKYPTVGSKNVKTHYNNHKGDVMFTFYNGNVEWNLCFNERMDKWTTRYSWTPLYSANINNTFYSLDKKRTEVLTCIYKNTHTNWGIRTGNDTQNNIWGCSNNTLSDYFKLPIRFEGIDKYTELKITINDVKTSYLDENGVEHFVNVIGGCVPYLFQDQYYIKFDKNNLLYDVEGGKIPNLPIYFILNVTLDIYNEKGQIASVNDNIGVITDHDLHGEAYNELLTNGFYIHGRSSIFDEMNYNNESQDDNICPTKWYNKQEPFEFEFVVNDSFGAHKIFDNLRIISNNAEPESITVEIIGDVYGFDKKNMYWNKSGNNKVVFVNDQSSIKWDYRLNEYIISTTTKCMNIKKYGRIKGNIHYKEDSWYHTISPLLFKQENSNKIQSARIRDKFMKVRIRYSGSDPVIVMGIITLYTISYA